jgi:hypothetical protein
MSSGCLYSDCTVMPHHTWLFGFDNLFLNIEERDTVRHRKKHVKKIMKDQNATLKRYVLRVGKRGVVIK